MNISLNLEDYAAQMNRRGWVVIPAVFEQQLVARMLDDIEKAWVTCRAIMERNGVATDAELTVHHLIGQQDSFLDLLGELEPLMPYLEHYFGGKFILNSFGGAINTKGHTSYAQRVHRDIRSFSGDLPLMMNTLIMLDEFTPKNGATWMLSGSHKAAEKPSDETFKAHAEQALGPVGSILMFNSNVWHAGGDNQTDAARRSVTPMFSKPFLKQQFDYPRAVGYDRADEFRPHVRQMIGYNARVPATLDEWYQPPARRMYVATRADAMRDLNQEFDDNEHRQYAYDFDYRMHAFMMRRFEASLPRGRAVEFGCYHGDFTRLLTAHYADLTVIEGAGDLVEIARSRVPASVRFVHSRFEDFEPDGLYDAAFLVHTLEHIDDPVAVLRRIRSWLSPTGRLFVVVPNAHAASRQIAVGMRLIPYASAVTEGEHLHGHRRTYSLDVLKNDVLQAGFGIEDFGGIMFKPLANFQLDRCLAEGIIGEPFLDGCYELGKLYPDLCASIFTVCSPDATTKGHT